MRMIISKRGRISIPGSLCEKYRLTTGSRLECLERGGGILLVPVPDDPIKAFRGKARGEVKALLRERRWDKVRETKRRIELFSLPYKNSA